MIYLSLEISSLVRDSSPSLCGSVNLLCMVSGVGLPQPSAQGQEFLMAWAVPHSMRRMKPLLGVDHQRSPSPPTVFLCQDLSYSSVLCYSPCCNTFQTSSGLKSLFPAIGSRVCLLFVWAWEFQATDCPWQTVHRAGLRVAGPQAPTAIRTCF